MNEKKEVLPGMGRGKWKNRMNRIKCSVVLAALLMSVFFMPVPAFAEEVSTEGAKQEVTKPSQDERFKEMDYVIDSYDVHLVLKENNEMEITEKITAFFHMERHGIYRTIPLKNQVRRLDGTVTNNRARVSDLSVSENYDSEMEGDNLRVQIGDAGEYVKGEHNYEIRYTYKLGKDPLDGKDEFYFNLIGTGWTTAIGNVTFTIEMPKPFDAEKLGFSAGWERSASSEGIHWNVDGQTISGNYDGILEAGQGLTVRVELPEDYFVNAGFENRLRDWILLSVPVLCLIISFLLWLKYGKDDIVVETVEFYPPDGINSLDAAYLYKGAVTGKDVTSLLIYLAGKGYLRIEETEEKGVFKKKKSFRIVLLRDYDGNDPNEETFMKGLFSRASEGEGLGTVTMGRLYDSFYVTTGTIVRNMGSRERKQEVFEKNTSFKSLLVMLMVVASAVCISLPPILTYGMPLMVIYLIPSFFGFGFCFALLMAGKGKGREKGKMKRNTGTKLVIALFCAVFGVVPIAMGIFPLMEDRIHMIGFFVGCACVLGMLLCFFYMPKRTAYGIRMLGRLEGFRNFLQVAEKERLEQLVMENPQYFYDILPYTYVLGVSDTWIRKFEEINLQAPEWYYGSYYDVHSFGEMMDRTMSTVDRAMTSSPSESSSGGGGSSGGGFSGGGSGGGGGGSW